MSQLPEGESIGVGTEFADIVLDTLIMRLDLMVAVEDDLLDVLRV